VCDGSEDPGGEAAQDAGWLVDVQQRERYAVELARDGLLDAVVEEQPAVLFLGPHVIRAVSNKLRIAP
jgi:hypothetical protein